LPVRSKSHQGEKFYGLGPSPKSDRDPTASSRDRWRSTTRTEAATARPNAPLTPHQLTELHARTLGVDSPACRSRLRTEPSSDLRACHRPGARNSDRLPTQIRAAPSAPSTHLTTRITRPARPHPSSSPSRTDPPIVPSTYRARPLPIEPPIRIEPDLYAPRRGWGPAEKHDRGPAEKHDRGPAEKHDRGPAEKHDRGPAEKHDRETRPTTNRPAAPKIRRDNARLLARETGGYSANLLAGGSRKRSLSK
jgi:hypothetical protein